MKGKELAELLMQHPDAEVVVAGYEDNLNPIKMVILTRVRMDKSESTWERLAGTTYDPRRIYGELTYQGTEGFEKDDLPDTEAIYIGYGDTIGSGFTAIKGDFLLGNELRTKDWQEEEEDDD